MTGRVLLIAAAIALEWALSHHLAERDLLTSLIAQDPLVPAAVATLYLLRLAVIVLVPAFIVRHALARLVHAPKA